MTANQMAPNDSPENWIIVPSTNGNGFCLMDVWGELVTDNPYMGAAWFPSTAGAQTYRRNAAKEFYDNYESSDADLRTERMSARSDGEVRHEMAEAQRLKR